MSARIPAARGAYAVERGIFRGGARAHILERSSRQQASLARAHGNVLGERIHRMAEAVARDAQLTWQEELMRSADHQNGDQS